MSFDPVEDLKLALIGVLNHGVSLSSLSSKKVHDYKKQKITQMEILYMRGDAKAILGIVAELSIPKAARPIKEINIRLPFEIRDEVLYDLAEAERCYNADALRSSIILCGRILETALHRKYYDVTGRDLLETSPGIGLGNILAKLKESNIEIDPAVSQQIHLINNVRIFSVHKKSTAFQPSKEQAQATMLFTIDILKKLF